MEQSVNIRPHQEVQLSLENNQLTNVTALSGLTALTSLALNDNQLTDLTALSGLTALTWLSLSANQLSDIGPLVLNGGSTMATS